MTIDMNENSSIAFTFSVIAIAVACIAMYGCHQVETTEQEAIKAGLFQKQHPGSAVPIWTKE